VPATEGSPALTIVVPVFQNAPTLEPLAERIARSVTDISYELLFVDDASPDEAVQVLRRLADRDGRVCCLSLAENVGQNTAVVAGLAHARGDVVVVMDGDLQDPPEAVPYLVRELDRRGVDAVFAGRRGRYESLPRLVGSRAFKRLLWLLTAGRVPADAGLFVAMGRGVAARVASLAGFEPYVVVLVARAARRVASVPVERAQGAGSSYTAPMRGRLVWRALRAIVVRGTTSPTYRVADRIGRRFAAMKS